MSWAAAISFFRQRNSGHGFLRYSLQHTLATSVSAVFREAPAAAAIQTWLTPGSRPGLKTAACLGFLPIVARIFSSSAPVWTGYIFNGTPALPAGAATKCPKLQRYCTGNCRPSSGPVPASQMLKSGCPEPDDALIFTSLSGMPKPTTYPASSLLKGTVPCPLQPVPQVLRVQNSETRSVFLVLNSTRLRHRQFFFIIPSKDLYNLCTGIKWPVRNSTRQVPRFRPQLTA